MHATMGSIIFSEKQRQVLIDRNWRHGMTKTKIYRIWKRMKCRCYNKNTDDYPDYGAKGVRMCKRWKNNFLNFFNDMGDCPPGKSIDRINTRGNYSPKNCRWATVIEQSWNKRTTIRLRVNGEILTTGEASNKYGISKRLIRQRLRLGMDAQSAATRPIGRWI